MRKSLDHSTTCDEAPLVYDTAPPTEAVGSNAEARAVGIPVLKAPRELTAWRVAMIAFVFTCSGPGGLEAVVQAGGPLWAFIGVFAVPVFFVLPQIFVVAELGAMMPTAAGNVVWVHEAFGEAAGFYNAWISVSTNMVDAATYPVLFGDYIVSSFHPDATYMEKVAYRLTGLVVGSLLSLQKAKHISTLSTVGSAAVITFVLVCFARAMPNVNVDPWGESKATTDFGLLGSALLWLFTGWTALGSLAGETTTPTTLLKGLSSALIIDMMVYLTAMMAAITVTRDVSEWEDGFFVTAFDRIIPGIGPYFGACVIFTALTLFVGALTCYARSLWGVSKMGWAPAIGGRQLPTGAPWVAILAHVLLALTLVWFDFGFIVQLEYTVAATSYIITYAAFVRLRYSQPDTPRPYVVPGGLPFAWALTIVKVVIMTSTFVAGMLDWRIAVATVAANVAVGLAYAVLRWRRKRGYGVVDERSIADAMLDAEDP